MEKSIFEQMGGTYRREGDYLIPNISVPDTKEYNIGKYGNLHRQFLEKNYQICLMCKIYPLRKANLKKTIDSPLLL